MWKLRLHASVIGLALSTSVLFAQKPAAEPFGTTADGTQVEIYTLENEAGLKTRIMTRGATVVSLMVPDKDGNSADVILGFDDVAGFESDANQYFGNTTGRVCNRIAEGKFTIDGTEYKLAVNNGPNHLHGGVERSLDKVVWSARPFNRKKGTGVKFTYTSPDGEEGYPGTVEFAVEYFLPNDKNHLAISYTATTDKATPINLTNHMYFNLAGAGTKSAMYHALKINADNYTPCDENLIPTGEIASVQDSPLDFRKMQPIGKRIETLDETPAAGYDHNYVLNPKPEGKPMVLAAALLHRKSKRRLRIITTEPGIQFYTGNFLSGQAGKDGKAYARRSAICLETQHYPDSVNHENFPTTIVQPGETYSSKTVYQFSVDKPKEKQDNETKREQTSDGGLFH